MENAGDNSGGIRGMANPRRYGIERVAYILMRITGLGLLAYFVGHIYETSIQKDRTARQGKLERDACYDTDRRGSCVFGTCNRNVCISSANGMTNAMVMEDLAWEHLRVQTSICANVAESYVIKLEYTQLEQ